ncbi:MAG: adenosylmethionine decarboxylase [Candidatus Syntropharchaeia archaeon]
MDALGSHLLVELYGCDRDLIDDISKVEEIMLESVNISGATMVKSVFHRFSPHGVSGVVVISESHFSIHSWPEHGYCAVDIFTCGDNIDNKKALKYLKEELKANFISVTEVKRGILAENKEREEIDG